MTGTFGGALEARGVRADEERLIGETTGEIETTEDGVLVIRRIHIHYKLKADEANRAAINRAFETHPPKCPVYRSISNTIDITTELTVTSAED